MGDIELNWPGRHYDFHTNRVYAYPEPMTDWVKPGFNYYIERVIFNDDATIVFWDDKTKTVVRLAENCHDDRNEAIRWAMAKKLFGSRSQLEKRLGPIRNYAPLWNDCAAVYTMLMMLFDSDSKKLDMYVSSAVAIAEVYRNQK